MPNNVYTVAERIEIVLQHAQGLSFRKISDHFAAANPNRPIPSISTIGSMVQKFRKTGTISAYQKIIKPSARLSDDTKLDICLKAVEDKDKPISQIAKELHVSKTSVRRVLIAADCWPSKLRSLDLVHVDVKPEPMEYAELNIKTEPLDSLEVDEPDPEADPLRLKTEPVDIKQTFIKAEPFSDEP